MRWKRIRYTWVRDLNLNNCTQDNYCYLPLQVLQSVMKGKIYE